MTLKFAGLVSALALTAALGACATAPGGSVMTAPAATPATPAFAYANDIHSNARPAEARVGHVALDLTGTQSLAWLPVGGWNGGALRNSVLPILTLALPQIAVIALLAAWGYSLSALIVTGVLAAQIAAMPKLIRDPAKYAPWYNGVGVTLYVLGMLAAALGLGGYI